jgi:hypothetical protein
VRVASATVSASKAGDAARPATASPSRPPPPGERGCASQPRAAGRSLIVRIVRAVL